MQTTIATKNTLRRLHSEQTLFLGTEKLKVQNYFTHLGIKRDTESTSSLIDEWIQTAHMEWMGYCSQQLEIL